MKMIRQQISKMGNRADVTTCDDCNLSDAVLESLVHDFCGKLPPKDFYWVGGLPRVLIESRVAWFGVVR